MLLENLNDSLTVNSFCDNGLRMGIRNFARLCVGLPITVNFSQNGRQLSIGDL